MPHPPWLRTGPESSPEQVLRRSHRGRFFAVALSVVVQLPGFAFAVGASMRAHRFDLEHIESDPFALVAVLLGIVAALCLLLRWSGPRVLVVGLLALPAIALAPGPPLAGVAVAFAVAGAVLRASGAWVWSTLLGMGVIGVLTLVVNGVDGASGGVRMLIVTIVLCVIAGAVTGAGARRERFRSQAREASSRRRSAAEEERLRIARELHDVLAHSLSQISVQAGVGLHLFDEEPDRAKESLRSIRETSTSALDEVRSVLGVLREPDAGGPPRSPGPTLQALPALVAEVRAAGLVVDVSGAAAGTDVGGGGVYSAVPLAVQSAAYRIVQESLTNVRRHSVAGAASVRVDVSAEAVTVVIENDPPVTARPREADGSSGGGRGVLGMRERAVALGGTLEAGPRADGGYTVVARLPLHATEGGT